MYLSTHYNLWQMGNGLHRLQIQRDLTQGCGKGIHTRQCQPAHRHPMRRPQQHHAPDGAVAGCQARIGQRCRTAGIDVARVGHDERLGSRARAICIARYCAHQGLQQTQQAVPLAGIESSSYGGLANGVHLNLLSISGTISRRWHRWQLRHQGDKPNIPGSIHTLRIQSAV